MGGEPSSIRRLRRFSDAPTKDNDPIEMARVVLKESDRAAVVISASMLEDQLREALRTHFVDMDKEQEDELRIFNFDGPLGTFSAKITMSYALGIIDEVTRDNLIDIRHMRNACAHAPRNIDFSTPELANVCKRLFTEEKGFFRLPDNSRYAMRNSFVINATVLSVAISHGSRKEAAKFLVDIYAELEDELEERQRAFREKSLSQPPEPSPQSRNPKEQ